MSRINGQIVTCERCQATIFRECTGEKERDGGFTRWNTFAPLPEDWGSGPNHEDLCPKCNALWENLKTDFMEMHGEVGK